MDLLSILLRAHDEGEQTEENLRDELLTMLLAGHDTTALTLTYAWYLLSQHPEAEAKLHRELDEVLGGDADVRARARTGLPRRVIQEAMRLYPPVYTIFREPTEDATQSGYEVEPGRRSVPQWVLHRTRGSTTTPRHSAERWTDGVRATFRSTRTSRSAAARGGVSATDSPCSRRNSSLQRRPASTDWSSGRDAT